MSDESAAAKVADSDDDAPKPSDSVADFLSKARKRYSRAVDWEDDNRKHALECLKFRNLEQWDPEVKNLREKDPEGSRPCLVVDKTNQYLNQVINDYRQNRPSIKVRPVDDKGDPEVAEVFQGIVRHIEDKSSADIAYDTGYESSVDGGFGYLRVLTEYCDQMSFDQDIRIVRIKNRFTVFLDPDRDMPHKPPAWGFIVAKVPRTEFKDLYPKANQMDFATDGMIFDNWAFEDYVIVAEYFYVEKTRKKICMYTDGSVYEDGKAPPDLQKAVDAEGKEVERTTLIDSVKWKKITAAEILEERDWLGKYVPIVEFVGTELDIEGKSHKSGLLKQAMTPQAIHNYAASSFVEGVMLAPRASWVAAEGQIQGYEELYRTANRRSISVLPYKPVVADGGVAVPPPQRVQPPGLSVGWMQTMQNTEHDIQASMGMYANTMLGQGDANSGKQELIQQRRGDTATFHYSDNAARAIRFVGTLLVDLIPKVYDTARVVRILGEDGETEQAEINPEQRVPVRKVQSEDGAIRKIYNLNVGKYDVSVTVGPAYATKRIEAVEWLTTLIQAQPDLIHVAGDILFRNMDAPGAEELSKRFKALLPAPVQALEDGSDGPQVQTPRGPVSVQEAGQIIGQLEQAQVQATQLLESKEIKAQEAKALDAQNEAAALDLKRHAEARAQAETAERMRLDTKRVEIDEYRAVTDRMKLEMTGEQQAAEAAQSAAEMEQERSLATTQ